MALFSVRATTIVRSYKKKIKERESFLNEIILIYFRDAFPKKKSLPIYSKAAQEDITPNNTILTKNAPPPIQLLLFNSRTSMDKTSYFFSRTALRLWLPLFVLHIVLFSAHV